MKHDTFAKISLSDAILWQFLCSHSQSSEASELRLWQLVNMIDTV